MTHEDRSKLLVVSYTSTIFCHLLKDKTRKSLLVIDENGVPTFINDPPTPTRFPILNPLMTLTFWGERAEGACVALAGTAHAKFERKYLKNGMQRWIEFAGVLPEDVFNRLLSLHPLPKTKYCAKGEDHPLRSARAHVPPWMRFEIRRYLYSRKRVAQAVPRKPTK